MTSTHRSSRPRGFQLWSIRHGDGVVVWACGRLSLGHGASEDLWKPHVRRAARVRLDLRGVTHVDARGLGVLAAMASLARERGTALSVAGASPVVRSMATVTRLDQVLTGNWDSRATGAPEPIAGCAGRLAYKTAANAASAG